MLEDFFVFETSGSCTLGGAGSVLANLAVLTITKVHLESSSLPLLGFLEVQSPSHVSGEGMLGKPMVTSQAKVVPCRSLSPAAGWGGGGMWWKVGLRE